MKTKPKRRVEAEKCPRCGALMCCRMREYYKRQLDKIGLLLDEAGVPEFVREGDVPANAPTVRVKWFLNRRKSVSNTEWEQEGELNREMAQVHSWMREHPECFHHKPETTPRKKGKSK